MENLTFDLEELYNAARDRALAEGAYSREAWNDIVENVLDEKREFAEIHDDEDWVELREALQARYDDVQSEVEEM